MPETPDFDSIASRLVIATGEAFDVPVGTDYRETRRAIRAVIVDVWNARGAADRAVIDDVADLDPTAHWAPPIRRTIQSLDR